MFSQFRQLSSGVLVCTDVMGRGVDIPEVHWVIQHDPPTSSRSVFDILFWSIVLQLWQLPMSTVCELSQVTMYLRSTFGPYFLSHYCSLECFFFTGSHFVKIEHYKQNNRNLHKVLCQNITEYFWYTSSERQMYITFVTHNFFIVYLSFCIQVWFFYI